MLLGDGGMIVAPPSTRPGVGVYRWLDETVPIAAAPAWLLELVQERSHGECRAEPEIDIKRVMAALAAIPNNDVGWTTWNYIGMATWRATGGSEKDCAAFEQWSAKSNKHKSENSRERWEHYATSPPTDVGAGTLVYLAAGGWKHDAHFSRTDETAALQSTCAADVVMVAVEWLWQNRFALGKLGIIAGLPDEGKGLLLSYIAAQVTRGGAWPCGEGIAPLGNVLLFTAEDDLNDTVVPRLAAAGADLSRITIINMVRESGADRMFSLLTDLEMLRQKIVEVGNVVLVLIDPISAYLGVGKIDSYRTTDVRAVLGPVVSLAAELKLAIIGIMHFNKKLDITNALLRISDSLAYGATARHVYGVINDTENKRKLVVRAKNNLAANTAEQTTLAFGFGVREVGVDPKNGKTIVAPYVIWEPQYVDVTATEAMQAASENRSPGARDEAKKFLLAMLANGPVAKTAIEEAAKAEGISERTLYRAKRELKNIVAKKDAADGGWTWRLVED